jgi:O-antigen biosynthesis protein
MENLLSQTSQLKPAHIRPPFNWVGHIPFAFWLIEAAKPEVVTELGTHTANSYFAFCQSVHHHHLATQCYAVDSWEGDEHAGYYGNEVYLAVAAHNQQLYSEFSTLMRMNFDEARSSFADGSIDLLHIDGMHSYDTVRHDFETWLPKMSDKGIVLFHDIMVREREFGVWRLWAELSVCYPSLSFDHSCGLGVLFIGKRQPAAIIALIEACSSAENRAFISHYFALSGERIEQACRIDELLREAQERENQIMKLADELQERDARMTKLVNSSSWKLMKPVRKITKSIHKRQRKIKNLFLLLAGRLPAQTALVSKAIPQDRNDYEAWIAHYDTLDRQKQQLISDETARMKQRPLISILMMLSDPSPIFLDNAIISVKNQLYPNWELCIADDNTSDKRIRTLITKHARKDSRIKYAFSRENSHPPAVGNAALELASGDYTALLDHDALLAPDALYWIAREITNNPGTALLYSDEDKIDAAGKRCKPYFKSDFDYTLFLCQNMTAHIAVYNTGLIRRIGGFRSGFDGADDYDLTLRLIELPEATLIRHIPKVLYHSRLNKPNPHSHSSALKALDEHLQRMDIDAHAEPAPEASGMNRVRYHVPAKPPSVEIIILTRDKPSLLKQCIETLLEKTTYPNYSITIVDNGSEESETLQLLLAWQQHPHISIVRDDAAFNFSRLNNQVVMRSEADVICLMNNDMEVITADWLHEMVGHALQEKVGAVGARLWYPNETLQHGGVILGLGGLAGHANKNIAKGENGYCHRASLQQSFSAVTAACMVVRREHYLSIGGLEEQNLSVAFNDVDFCLKLREKGFRNLWTPYAEFYHHESASRGEEDTPEKQARIAKENSYMKRRWVKEIQYDPAYSRNLTIEFEDFALAWPPRADPQP